MEQLLPVIKDGYEASFYFLPDNLDPDSFVSKFGKIILFLKALLLITTVDNPMSQE